MKTVAVNSATVKCLTSRCVCVYNDDSVDNDNDVLRWRRRRMRTEDCATVRCLTSFEKGIGGIVVYVLSFLILLSCQC